MGHSTSQRNLTSKEFLSADDYDYMKEIAADAEVDEFLRLIATYVLDGQPEKAAESMKLLGEDSLALLENPELQWALAVALEYGVARGSGISAALLGHCYKIGFLVDQDLSQAKKLCWQSRLLSKSWITANPMEALPCFKSIQKILDSEREELPYTVAL